MLSVVVLWGAFLCSPVEAEDVSSFVKGLHTQSESYEKEAKNLHRKNFLRGRVCTLKSDCRKKPQSHKKPVSSKNELLIFVSFSMPEASLKRLSEELDPNHHRLIMRGLIDNSFPKTAAKIQDLGIQIDIDPEPFKEYDIQVVPTFVQLKEGKETKRLQGDVTLPYVLEKFDA